MFRHRQRAGARKNASEPKKKKPRRVKTTHLERSVQRRKRLRQRAGESEQQFLHPAPDDVLVVHGDVLRDVARGQAAHLGERWVLGRGAEREIRHERDPDIRALLSHHLRHERRHLGLEHERLRAWYSRRSVVRAGCVRIFDRRNLPEFLVAHLRQLRLLVVGKLAPPFGHDVRQHAVPEMARLERFLSRHETHAHRDGVARTPALELRFHTGVRRV